MQQRSLQLLLLRCAVVLLVFCSFINHLRSLLREALGSHASPSARFCWYSSGTRPTALFLKGIRYLLVFSFLSWHFGICRFIVLSCAPERFRRMWHIRQMSKFSTVTTAPVLGSIRSDPQQISLEKYYQLLACSFWLLNHTYFNLVWCSVPSHAIAYAASACE